MLPVATGTITFVVVETVYLNTMWNLEAGFLPAIAAGLAVGGLTSAYLARKDAERDSPPAIDYRVPAPQAMAEVKRVLKTYYNGNDRWHINYDDKQNGQIQASFRLSDDSYEDMKWLVPSGRIDKTINLHLSLTPKPKSVTSVQMFWVVNAPLSRSDCNTIIDETAQLIHQALLIAETNR